MNAPEYRFQVKRWFVETGFCDGGGVGHWVETEESVEVAGEVEATTLTENWLASGKLIKMPWGELRPQWPYGLFRVRQVWEDIREDAVAETIRKALAAQIEVDARIAEEEGWEPDKPHLGITEREEESRDCAERIAAAIRARGGA